MLRARRRRQRPGGREGAREENTRGGSEDTLGDLETLFMPAKGWDVPSFAERDGERHGGWAREEREE